MDPTPCRDIGCANRPLSLILNTLQNLVPIWSSERERVLSSQRSSPDGRSKLRLRLPIHFLFLKLPFSSPYPPLDAVHDAVLIPSDPLSLSFSCACTPEANLGHLPFSNAGMGSSCNRGKAWTRRGGVRCQKISTSVPGITPHHFHTFLL